MIGNPDRHQLSRAAVIMHGAAVLLLLAAVLWGASVYSELPDVMPTHWNLKGEADAFSQKSPLGMFTGLLIGAAAVLVMLVVNFLVNRVRHLVPAERRANDLVFGYLSLSSAVIFVWVSVAGWYGLSLGAVFLVFALMAGLPVLLIYGMHLSVITRERDALIGPEEPSRNRKYWVFGGLFYSNPTDPRAFVPRPPRMGTGVTMNLATPGGRLVLIGVLVVLIGSVALLFI